MNKNQGLIVYLSGPIENAPDKGVIWRQKYKKILESLFNWKVIDPCEEEVSILKDHPNFNQYKTTDICLYKSIMCKFIQMDMNFVNESNLVIIKWNGEVSAGTFGEAQEAHLKGIPVYLVTSISEKDIPGWFLACTTMIFKEDIDLFDFLINNFLTKEDELTCFEET